MNLDPDITQEDLQVFLDEAEEQLQLLDTNIVGIEGRDDNSDLIQEIFRAAHTLKGSSAMLGYREMTDLGHAMETLLDKVRKGSLAPSTNVVDALLHSLDKLRLLKDALIEPPEAPIDVSGVVAELIAAGGGESSEPAKKTTVEGLRLTDEEQAHVAELLKADVKAKALLVRATLIDECEWGAVRWFQVLGELAEAGQLIASNPTQHQIEEEEAGTSLEALVLGEIDSEELVQRVRAVADIATAEIEEYKDASEIKASSAGAGAGTKTAQTIRVDVERLDLMMNVIGELVIDRGRITQIGRDLEAKYRGEPLVKELSKTSAHIVKVVTELQDRVMEIRMLPIGTVFGGFPRLVRDLAQSLDKKVEFVVTGQDTEIDRTVIERVRDPIVHLLRNAVDHGLEAPEERRKARKSEKGVLTLSAYHEQGHIVIEVGDDGRGIDLDALRASAVKNGFLTQDAASKLSDQEARELIFLAGNSTAKKTTDVSGRGVGMDIVRSNIEVIGGFVSVESEVGRGTTLKLRLPLTLATVQSLLVLSDGDVFAVPLVYVLETRRVPKDEVHIVNHHEVFNLRGSVLPLVRLTDAVGWADRRSQRADDEYVVVVRSGETQIGLVVDTVIEPQEIVVKPLGGFIGDVRGVAGASILGDGRVALILDIGTMINSARQQGAFAAARSLKAESAAEGGVESVETRSDEERVELTAV
ncbi:MAG: chemotaxis protein CheA [Chloroflexi bacterium]|nr:chemotaxis protein CheA [Chloroflexota bacterium]